MRPPYTCLPSVIALVAVMGTGALSGCQSESQTPGTTSITGCTPACAAGMSCQAGKCVAAGTTTTPGVNPASGTAVGAACAQGSDCADGLCLNGASFPGGACSKACGGQVISVGDPCPTGAACSQLNEAASTCLDLCGGANGDCRAGYVCSDRSGASVCVPGCKSDRDCPQGTGCDTGTGQCKANAHLGRAGAACSDPTQCESGLCVTEPVSKGVFPGGFCVHRCSAPEVDKSCTGDDGICVDLPSDNGTQYVCLPACNTGVDCRDQYMCSAEAQVKAPDGRGVCIPRCGNFKCDPGYTCNTAVGICTKDDGTGPAPGVDAGVGGMGTGGMGGTGTSGAATVEHVAVGGGMVGSTKATFGTVSVQVPEGAVSFSLIAKPSDPASVLTIVGVIPPSGPPVFDYFDPLKTAFKVADLRNPGAIALLYPNAPRISLLPGKYQVVYGTRSDQPTNIQVDLLLKRQNGAPQTGSLPVVFWFTKQKYMDAQSAQTDPDFQQTLSLFSQIYADAGIKLGPFTYIDITGPDATRFALIDNFDQLPPLFQLADNSDLQALHIFLIDQFAVAGAEGLLGKSGGIPGPPAFKGLAHGGVAGALAFVKQTTTMATIMAHEGGHFLGLFHTTEKDGSAFDPLLDTPECPPSANVNGDMILDDEECAGKGADNLMFWGLGRVPMRKLTNDQRFVLLRNPVVQ